MGSGRTGAARSATSASVASMAFVITGTKMCVLIYLVFSPVAYLRDILRYIILYHIPNLFCPEPPVSARGKRRRGKDIYLL